MSEYVQNISRGSSRPASVEGADRRGAQSAASIDGLVHPVAHRTGGDAAAEPVVQRQLVAHCRRMRRQDQGVLKVQRRRTWHAHTRVSCQLTITPGRPAFSPYLAEPRAQIARRHRALERCGRIKDGRTDHALLVVARWRGGKGSKRPRRHCEHRACLAGRRDRSNVQRSLRSALTAAMPRPVAATKMCLAAARLHGCNTR